MSLEVGRQRGLLKLFELENWKLWLWGNLCLTCGGRGRGRVRYLSLVHW